MRTLSTLDNDFAQQLAELLAFETVNDPQLLTTVDNIIAQVRKGGDAVVLNLTQQFDRHPAQEFSELEISSEQLKAAFDNLASDVKQALELSAQRVREFHQHQVQKSRLKAVYIIPTKERNQCDLTNFN